ncbi:hypothetical protein D3C87_1924720 [compost metagenome]
MLIIGLEAIIPSLTCLLPWSLASYRYNKTLVSNAKLVVIVICLVAVKFEVAEIDTAISENRLDGFHPLLFFKLG